MVKRCEKCSLSNTCKNPLIFGKGAGPKHTEVIIVQDCPTFFDDRCNQSPAGDTKAKINYFLEQAGLDYRKVYFTSAIKCAPKELSDVKNKHIEACREYLLSEIIERKPKLIIVMGKIAHQMLTEKTSVDTFTGHFADFSFEYEAEIGMGKIADITFKAKLLPTFSLAGSLRKWENDSEIIRHFQKGVRFLKDGFINKTPDPKVNLILTPSGLLEFEERMSEMTEAATDFETTGFEFFKDEIINAGYCSKIGEADIIYYSTYKKENIKKWDKENIDKAKEINSFVKGNFDKIQKTLKTVNGFKHLKLILHNGKFDWKFAKKNGIDFKNFYWCTLVADSLVDENLRHSLNFCLERRGIDFGPYDTMLWPYVNKDEGKKKSYRFIPPLMLTRYLGIDVDGDFRLYKQQINEIEKIGLTEHLIDRKMTTTRMLCEAEYIGVKMDYDLIKKTSRIIQKQQVKILSSLRIITEIPEFNPNSPKQINEYFINNNYPMEKLKIVKNKSGYSTGASELKKFMKLKKFAEVPKLILDAKKLAKIKGTYVDGKEGEGGMLQYLDENDRVHANSNNWTPRTGRESVNRPSLQVWPRPIKGLPVTRNFVIPTKGMNLFEGDFKALEQFVVASLSKDMTLITTLRSGCDIHSKNAVELGHILGMVDKSVDYQYFLDHVGKGAIKEEDIPPELFLKFNDLRTKAKCLHKDTRIPTEYGILKISDLVQDKNDSNWIQKIDLKVSTGEEVESAIRINHKWNEKEFKVFTKHGEIIGDGLHPLLVWRDCKVEEVLMKDLKETDYLIKPRTEKLFASKEVELEFRTFSPLFNQRATTKVTSWIKSGKSVMPLKLPQTLDRDLAFLLGFITAEGSSFDFSFTQKKSEEVVEHLENSYFRLFGIALRGCNNEMSGVRSFRIPKTIQNFFIENGLLKTKSATVRVPEAIFKSPKDVIREYVRGYFEGDGSKHKAVSKSKGLIDDLILLLNNFNIFPSYNESWNTNPHDHKKSLYHELSLESYEFVKFSKEIKYFSERKNKKLRLKVGRDSRKVYGLEVKINELKKIYTKSTHSIINGKRVKFGEKVHSQQVCEITYERVQKSRVVEAIKAHSEFTGDSLYRDIQYLINNNCQLSKVEKVVGYNGRFKHYDITVDHKNHNFIANGFLSKNCVGFGLNYGKGADSFADEFKISKFDAQEMIDAYFEIYWEMKAWRDRLIREGFKNGYITLESGRRRRFHAAVDWLESEASIGVWSADRLRGEIERQIMNYPVQGGAHEAFESGVIRVNDYFKKEKMKARLLLRLHDGIVGECPPEENEQVMHALKTQYVSTFNKGTKYELSLGVDVGFYASCWYGEKLKFN